MRQPHPESVRGTAIAGALPMPILVIGPRDELLYANQAAEQFFAMGIGLLLKHRIADLVSFGSPLLELVSQARERGASIGERDVDLSSPKIGEHIADVNLTPSDNGTVILLLQERGLAQRIDRQLMYRGAARSMSGMAAVLAHEIKNPLAGIKGAAQLLEDSVPPGDRALTQLICNEADRIRDLIDRMESFGDAKALARKPVNIHEVLDRVKRVAQTSFGRNLRIVEAFDPSLPPVPGDRDSLIQAFMNIVRNAADAAPAESGEIVLASAYRAGVKIATPAAGNDRKQRVSLPLEITVRDNGAGIPSDLLPYIFDPFITTKSHGAGLGLALVAKIVADHGGVIECESQPRRTVFRVLLPVAPQDPANPEAGAGHA